MLKSRDSILEAGTTGRYLGYRQEDEVLTKLDLPRFTLNHWPRLTVIFFAHNAQHYVKLERRKGGGIDGDDLCAAISSDGPGWRFVDPDDRIRLLALAPGGNVVTRNDQIEEHM